MNELAPQILNTQSTKDLTFPESSRYTCMTLLKAVDNALEKPGNKKNRHKPIQNLQKGRRKDLLPLAAAFFSSFLFFRSIRSRKCILYISDDLDTLIVKMIKIAGQL